MSDVFIGRRAELAQLDAEWERVICGIPRVVWITGEAGNGKTAFVREWIAGLGAETAKIVATADSGERELEYSLLQQLGVTDVGVAEDALSAGASLLHHLGACASDRPLVLAVDDAHDGDAQSLQALAFAVRRLRADAVLTLVLSRPVQPTGPLESLRRLAADHGSTVELSGLAAGEVAELVQARGHGHLPAPAAERLRAHTGGSPLHVVGLCRELSSADLQGPDPLPAPRSFSLLVATTLAELPTAAQDLARAAAILGASPRIEAAARLAGILDAPTAADELANAGLLQPVHTSTGWELRWSHPLVRSAVYEEIGLADRVRLHRSAAQVADGTDALEHLVAASVGPDEDLAQRLVEAARAAECEGRVRTSAELLLKAHHLSAAAEEAPSRLIQCMDQLLLCGDVASVLPLLPSLVGLPETPAALQTRARLSWMSGDLAAARSLAERAWDGAPLDTAQLRVALAAMLAQIEILDGRPSAAVAWSDQVLALPKLSAAQRSAAQAGAVLALALEGEVASALGRIADLPEDPAAVAVERHPELRARGFAKMIGDDLVGAVPDLLAVASAMRLDPTPERLVALCGAAEAEYRAGHWSSAIGLAEQAASLGDDAEQTWVLGFLHSIPVLALAGRGNWVEAERHLRRALEVAPMIADEATRAYVADAQVHLDLCRGDPAAAVRHGRATVMGEATAPREPGIMRLPVHFASALVSIGQLDEAESLLTVLEARAQTTGRASRLCSLARVRGELAASRRDTAAARTSFEQAQELEEHADALEAGLIHLGYGRLRRRRGERRAAREQLTMARDLFQGLGAVPWVLRCDAELDLAGVRRPTADSMKDGDPLTPQERIVAELVCAGRTNQQVANDLVISVKTVGSHLGNVYTKLDIHSRTQLANHPVMQPTKDRSPR